MNLPWKRTSNKPLEIRSRDLNGNARIKMFHGSTGVYQHVGIPGTGIYDRKKISSSGTKKAATYLSSANPITSYPVQKPVTYYFSKVVVSIDELGDISIQDETVTRSMIRCYDDIKGRRPIKIN
jgi:hypothetical protein